MYIGEAIMLSLKNVMRVNAISCIAFGSLFALQPSLVANFLGGTPPAPSLYLVVLGVVLISNGFHLLWASRIALPRKELIVYFSAGDFIWIIASIGLMASGIWITTTGGVIVTSAIALMVGLFGVLQMTTRKAMGHC